MPTELTPRGRVYFIGAGPGDPELLTVKAQRLIHEADVILYAGSLVSPAVLCDASAAAEIHNTADMTLAKQIAVMADAARAGKTVARLHTGDPSVYGAIAEQMRELTAANVPYAIVPGVSSAMAAAAALEIEYTLPEETQTLILTRMAGKTPVPPAESLAGLASHRASMAIFLSTGMIEQVVDAFYAAGYRPDTPVAVVFRASWPDEKVIRSTLGAIAGELQRGEITHQSLIIVSPALRPSASDRAHVSRLYGSAQEPPSRSTSTAIIALTRNGTATGLKVQATLADAILYAPQRFLSAEDASQTNVRPYAIAVRQVLQDAFMAHRALVCVMASGIVVRELAPLLRSKQSDPAVVVVDEAGRYAVSLLSGHLGGANALARRVAEALGGTPVFTTASDTQGAPALDLLGAEWGWRIEQTEHLTTASAALVNGEPVGVWQEAGEAEWWPAMPPANLRRYSTPEALLTARPAAALLITPRLLAASDLQMLSAPVVYRPRCLVVGIGCNRGTAAEEIRAAIDETLVDAGLSATAVRCVATVEDKRDEPGLLAACTERGWPLQAFPRERLSAVPGLPNPSAAAQAALGVPGVAEPAALAAANASHLLVEKRKYANVTVAVAQIAPEGER